MIKITQKEHCCGCSACLHICPKHSISFQEDKEGFLYPKVDLETCIDCGLCEKVCPIINQDSEREPQKVYAAKNNDETIRLKSSSGGVFTLLAEKIQTILARGIANTRLRDFYDVYGVMKMYSEEVDKDISCEWK